jgi:hypothetical protein
MRRTCWSVLLAIPFAVLAVSAHAQTSCSAEDFAKAVDGAGAGLRAFNAQNAPKLQQRLRALKAKRGWSDAEFEEKSIDMLHDARIEELDRQSNDILARIDEYGATTQGPVDCSRLAELQAASIELLSTMRIKSAYMLTRLDAMIEDRPAGAAAAPPPALPQPKAVAKAPPDGPRPPAPAWSTETRPDAAALQSGGADAAPGTQGAEDGFTIDEIRDATRGFFGQVSTGLASVIEYAFQRAGRPTAYVLGQEGGGAFLAGLRYGDGTLYLRTGGTRKVYWHGPSIGYDIGAAGSRTMYLIYRLKNPDDLFRRYSGIDGSAYLVGGVGITFLTNGEVIMAPIRSGLGLRLGASIGYVRFSPTQTWNPF